MASGATATKGYLDQMTREDADDRDLISSGDSSDEDEDDSSPATGRRRAPSRSKPPPKWWFQHKEVKRNCLVVLGAWFLVCLSVVCFGAGIVLEVLYHTGTDAVLRGFILMIIGVLLFIPSGYAVTHVYLAAKRIGRIRMNTVWFFR